MIREKSSGENEIVLGLGLISGVISLANDFYFFSLSSPCLLPSLLCLNLT